jgi:hypothetical protein
LVVISGCFVDSLLEMRPKINLKFLDEKWFREVYGYAVVSSSERLLKNISLYLEKEEIWVSEEEMRVSNP